MSTILRDRIRREQYEKNGYTFDDGLTLAFSRAKTGANAHHFDNMLSAYHDPGRWPVTNTPDKHRLWQMRMRKLLNGMSADAAYEWWKPEFNRLLRKGGKESK